LKVLQHPFVQIFNKQTRFGFWFSHTTICYSNKNSAPVTAKHETS